MQCFVKYGAQVLFGSNLIFMLWITYSLSSVAITSKPNVSDLVNHPTKHINPQRPNMTNFCDDSEKSVVTLFRAKASRNLKLRAIPKWSCDTAFGSLLKITSNLIEFNHIFDMHTISCHVRFLRDEMDFVGDLPLFQISWDTARMRVQNIRARNFSINSQSFA